MPDILVKAGTPEPTDELALAATRVFETMIALREAFAKLHAQAQTDAVKQFCLNEQANFYTDKSILLRGLRSEGLLTA